MYAMTFAYPFRLISTDYRFITFMADGPAAQKTETESILDFNNALLVIVICNRIVPICFSGLAGHDLEYGLKDQNGFCELKRLLTFH